MNTGHEGSLTTVRQQRGRVLELVTMVKASKLDYETDVIGKLIALLFTLLFFSAGLKTAQERLKKY